MYSRIINEKIRDSTQEAFKSMNKLQKCSELDITRYITKNGAEDYFDLISFVRNRFEPIKVVYNIVIFTYSKYSEKTVGPILIEFGIMHNNKTIWNSAK